MKRTALILACLGMLSVGNVFAASIGSCADGVANVLTLTGGATCTLGELEFGNFSVNSPLNPGIISINGPASTDDGSTAWINFEFNPQGPGPAHYLFSYTVEAHQGFSLVGLDAEFGTYSGLIQMTETACSAAPDPGCGANVLGTLFIDTDPNTLNVPFEDSFSFAPTSKVWVSKDISVVTDASGLSDLFNSHHYRRDGDVPEVPEPTTMLLFSTALLGLGFMRRKKS